MKVFTEAGCTLHHGNFRDHIEVDGTVDLIVTSPPYNIGSKSPARLGGRKAGGYDAKSWGAIENYPDALPEDEYQKSQHDFLLWCARLLKPNGVIAYNHKLRHKEGRVISPTRWFPSESKLVIHDEIVWDRGSTHNHCPSFTYPQSERIYILKRPGASIYFKNQDFFWKAEDRLASVGDVWRIPPNYREADHDAPFPLNLARHCIRLWCPPEGKVCDPYSGAGTTMIASRIEGRRFIGTELMEKYFDLSVRRFKSRAALSITPA